MKTRFSVELTTGAISRFYNGIAVSKDQASVLSAGDILDAEIVLTANGLDITSAVAGSNQIVLGLRQFPSYGPLLAQSGSFALVAGVGTCVFNLNTSDILALVDSLPTAQSSTQVWFEVKIFAGDLSYRQTLAQQKFTLTCEVNMYNDSEPLTPSGLSFTFNRADITTLTSGLTPLAGAAIATIKTGNPIFLLYLNGALCAFRLRAIGSSVQTLPHLVRSTTDTGYIWELQSITKQGNPCEWSPSDSLFYQRIVQTIDGLPTSSLADTGFALPV